MIQSGKSIEDWFAPMDEFLKTLDALVTTAVTVASHHDFASQPTSGSNGGDGPAISGRYPAPRSTTCANRSGNPVNPCNSTTC